MFPFFEKQTYSKHDDFIHPYTRHYNASNLTSKLKINEKHYKKQRNL